MIFKISLKQENNVTPKVVFTVFIVLIILLFHFLLTGVPKKYEFLYHPRNINDIEIIKIEKDTFDCSEMIVVSKVNNIELFIKDVQNMQYSEIFFGDPSIIKIEGYAIKINYKNGEYEIFNDCSKIIYTNKEGWQELPSIGMFDLDEYILLLDKYVNYES